MNPQAILLENCENLLLEKKYFHPETNSQNSTIESEESATKNYAPEFRRWLILASFIFLNFVNGATWVVFYSIIEEAKTYYSVSETHILWFSWQFNIIYILISFPTSFIIAKYLSHSLILGSFMMALGSWIRYFAYKNFFLALFGQCFIALSTSFILAAPNTIANVWFPEKERFLVVTLGSASGAVGSGFGYFFSSLFIDDDPERIKDLLFVSAAILSFPLILSFLLIRKNLRSEEIHKKNTKIMKIHLWKSLKLLLQNKKYLLCNFSFSVCYGNCWNLVAMIDIFLQKEGVSSIMVGVIGLVLLLSGFCGSLLATLFLRYATNTKKYFDLMIKIMFVISTVSFISISILIPLGGYFPLLIISLLFLGLGAFGLQPFECEALEKIAYPVPEAISVNGFYFITNLIGLPLAFISNLKEFEDYGLWTLSVSLIPFSIYIIFFYKTNTK